MVPQLTSDEVNLLKQWIDSGANWPEGQTSAAKRNEHWAYQPIAQVVPPEVQNRSAIINPIDRFILARLESKSLTLSPEADRATLIRRLSLDLLGLLPTPEEVDDFIADTHPNAYERVVDRLLDSPHFGERWGRHWLDMALCRLRRLRER